MEEQNKILNTNPLKYIIAGLFVIALFFGGITVWSVYFPFQGAVIASGVVKVSGERKVVQHLEGGIIDKIFIKEGDTVKEGDVLIELKGSQVSSNVDLLRGRLRAKQAEAARLRAEAGMKSEIVWPKEFEKLKTNPEIVENIATETDIFTSRRSDIQGKIELHYSQIKQLENRIEGAREELASQVEIIENLEEDLKSKRPLLKEKYMGKTNILELERSLSTYKGQKGKLNQDIAQFLQMIEELKLRIVDIENQYREQAVSRLGDLTDVIFEIKEQIKPQLDAKERLEIRAPVSGVVINMQVHSEDSGVIRPGMPLLEIVPEDLKMIITTQVRPQDIISVKKGQDTKVQLAAFQRKSTPPVKGMVTYVSPDLMSQQTAQGIMSYYEAHVEVDKNDLKAKNAYLSPGMPVSCYITTDKRTVISYLLGPLLKNVDMAMRE
ncbi:HlyD family type I secretion periplasmic adaptor subunit [Desulfobacula phenolica]|uniref:Membrane fusion protein, epimerase transport system n=1 Tax=Desulfobacula phenolica TaxID=90732 RepID=A0A1H2DP76_9BACT|nr:HlyD family type I secretion periplasmic adaptor subunit [Desulfobacula phenolica]SDT84649.1 membrane fusion protein, epimerase transport system [Desulfobacula phenolica]